MNREHLRIELICMDLIVNSYHGGIHDRNRGIGVSHVMLRSRDEKPL